MTAVQLPRARVAAALFAHVAAACKVRHPRSQDVIEPRVAAGPLPAAPRRTRPGRQRQLPTVRGPGLAPSKLVDIGVHRHHRRHAACGHRRARHRRHTAGGRVPPVLEESPVRHRSDPVELPGPSSRMPGPGLKAVQARTVRSSPRPRGAPGRRRGVRWNAVPGALRHGASGPHPCAALDRRQTSAQRPTSAVAVRPRHSCAADCRDRSAPACFVWQLTGRVHRASARGLPVDRSPQGDDVRSLPKRRRENPRRPHQPTSRVRRGLGELRRALGKAAVAEDNRADEPGVMDLRLAGQAPSVPRDS
ncbi:hypothetical protein RKD18_000367 [Streptomyces phaeoluteigriseus]